MNDYGKCYVGLLDMIDARQLERRDGAPIYCRDLPTFGIADGGYEPATAYSPRTECKGCGACDYERGVCSYCKRPA